MALLLPITLLGAETESYESTDKLPIVDFVGKGFLNYVGNFPGHLARGDERVKYMFETFGQPVKKNKKFKKEDWREPDLIKDHIIRYFDGLTIETTTEPAYKDEGHYIESIRVITLETSKYTVYKGIKIGMPFSSFVEILKIKKRKLLNDKITYIVGRHLGRLKATIFVSPKGIITKIVWDYLEG